ncbi:MAG: response regulator transcription factor [Chitinophagaceae bacterium]|nr:MAG: response regulator transcription factor [Chitinophagaceae bacterium]
MSVPPRTYSTVIIDDNEIDRLSAVAHARRFPFLAITAVYASADEAIPFLEKDPPDVLLLDIDMPGTSGLALRRLLGEKSACIFITSFPDYAVESFELAALDFLVKPLDKTRFEKAMDRLHDYLELREKANLFECTLGGNSIFIKEGHNQVKVPLHEIIYLEALKDYTRVVTPKKKYCVLSILGKLLQEAAFSSFVRIHRSYAVQKHFIEKITAQEVFVKDITLPVGRSYKASLEGLT